MVARLFDAAILAAPLAFGIGRVHHTLLAVRHAWRLDAVHEVEGELRRGEAPASELRGRLDQLGPGQTRATVQTCQTRDHARGAYRSVSEISAVVVEQGVAPQLSAAPKVGGPHVGGGKRACSRVKGHVLRT